MKNVWNVDEFRWRLREPYRLPHLVIRNIKCSWQRITKGYCDKDLWNIDGWFMDIMPNMLCQFKETRHGSPGVLGTEYVDADGIICNDTCHEEWDKILDEMIFLFREMNEETCKKKNPYEKVLDEFKKKYGKNDEYREVENNYYEAEKELEEYRKNCKNRAFELFSKWFHYLWD